MSLKARSLFRDSGNFDTSGELNIAALGGEMPPVPARHARIGV